MILAVPPARLEAGFPIRLTLAEGAPPRKPGVRLFATLTLLQRDGVIHTECTGRFKKNGSALILAPAPGVYGVELMILAEDDVKVLGVDGVVSAQLGLHGEPEPDIFTVASDNLGVAYDRTVVVEDAVSGVQAGARTQNPCPASPCILKTK